MATKVTVGVAGGIAAYKAVEVVRALQEAGLDPYVTLTAAAERFVSALTFAAISGHKVVRTLWTEGEVPEGAPQSSIEHIEEAQTSHALVVVPATANVLAKMAHGLADDALTTMYLAFAGPVIVAPAMNVVMWQHAAVRANVATLRGRGVRVVEPGEGYLACGMTGGGRLAAIADIVAAVREALRPRTDLAGETVLITAGGTREAIDPVRFLGNRSSGRMGHALAAAAAARGARVRLVTTSALPVARGVQAIQVQTAAEMREAVLRWLREATIVLKAAAVADFRTVTVEAGKLPRVGRRTLELEATEDIVAEVIKTRRPGTFVLAFAAEVEDHLARGRAKMERKGVDAILVNDVSPGHGFDVVRNAGTLLIGDRTVSIPERSKEAMAEVILDEIARVRGHGPES